MSNGGGWFAELRRRKVVRVAIVYLIASWLAIQVAAETFEPLGLPAWTVRLVIVLAALGLPLALALAWAFDVTPRGIERTPPWRRQDASSTRSDEATIAAPVAATKASSVAPPTTAQDDDESSVAILPFVDMSPEHDQDYFCDGIAEELIHALGRLEGVRVAARSSTFNAKHRNEDPQTLADRLKVGTILRGSVRKAGNRVRVTVQLENGADGYQMWSERWDRELTDIFAIQDDIAKGVVEKLKVTLVAGPGAALVLPATSDLEAYELYLRGRYQWNKRTPAALQEAVACFQQAIDRDPTYALAHAGLADSLALLNLYTGVPQRHLHARALAAAQRAVDLNGELPETHASLAFIKEHAEWAWSTAREHFTRALAINPKYSTAHHWYALFLAARGRHDDAVHHIRVAMELEPHSPAIQTSAGRILYVARRFDAAIAQYKQAQSLDSAFQPPWREIALPYLAKREAAAAREALEHALALLPSDDFALGHLSLAYAQAGQRDAAVEVRERLQRLSTPERSLSYQLAIAHLACGSPDAALQWLQIACEERIHWTVLLGVDPMFDAVRAAPAFTRLLEQMGLAVDQDR
jgi:TolB-like protein/Tfp pilus assembly protein PilF